MKNRKMRFLGLVMCVVLATAPVTSVYAETKADWVDPDEGLFPIGSGLEIDKGASSSTLETDYFTIDMPGTDTVEWKVTCGSPRDTLNFYCTTAKDAGNGGVVMRLKAYDWGDNSYADIPNAVVAGSDANKIYVAIFPTDVQYDSGNSRETADYETLKSWMENCKQVTEDSTYTIFHIKTESSSSSSKEGSANKYSVKVDSGYLALRDAESYDSANEIGKLYTGDIVVFVRDGSTDDYWYVYSWDLDESGYVNKNYLKPYEG